MSVQDKSSFEGASSVFSSYLNPVKDLREGDKISAGGKIASYVLSGGILPALAFIGLAFSELGALVSRTLKDRVKSEVSKGGEQAAKKSQDAANTVFHNQNRTSAVDTDQQDPKSVMLAQVRNLRIQVQSLDLNNGDASNQLISAFENFAKEFFPGNEVVKGCLEQIKVDREEWNKVKKSPIRNESKLIELKRNVVASLNAITAEFSQQLNWPNKQKK